MSSIAASDGTAPPADGFGHLGTLKTRILWALILAPVALLALYAGGAWFVALILAVTGAIAWEWRRICTRGRFDVAGWLFSLGTLCAVASVPLWGVAPAAGLAALTTALVWATAAGTGDRDAAWSAAGVVVASGAGIALLWLRAVPDFGFPIVLALMVAVWATDSCAMMAGRLVGGPRLAPHISPNKTWAGLAGGMAGAGVWGGAFALWYGTGAAAGSIATGAALGAAVALLAQGGDLGVSIVKRRFGAKDSSNLIPGHGGVLDRVDGFILSAPVAAIGLILFARGSAL